MSCQQNQNKSIKASVKCGIASTASKAAGGIGAAKQQTTAWLKAHPDQVSTVIGSMAGVGGAAVAAYHNRQRQLSENGEKARLQGTEGRPTVTVLRSTKASSSEKQARADAETMRAANQGIEAVRVRVGQPNVKQVTLGDDFAFADRVYTLTREDLAASPHATDRAMGKAYRVIKPLTVGHHYLGMKISRIPVVGDHSRVSATDLNHTASDEVALNLDTLQSRRAKRLDQKMGGRYTEYVAAREALMRVPRVHHTPGSTKANVQLATMDAIARRLVAPEFKGNRQGKYELAARVADWQAQKIARSTGEDTLDVLIRQAGIDPAGQHKQARPA
jgi:hypothetical protein